MIRSPENKVPPPKKRELYKSFPHCEFPSSKILLYLALSLYTYPETNLHVSRCESFLIEVGNERGVEQEWRLWGREVKLESGRKLCNRTVKTRANVSKT